MNNIMSNLKSLGSPEKAQHLKRFFKTGPGEYGEGDIFWGITVPLIRKTAREHKHLDVQQLGKMLEHEVHEVRLCALLIMVLQAKTAPDQMYNVYLKKTHCINNWDLVDLSAPTIVGNFLINKDCSVLYTLAQSKIVWERRIAIIATYAFIRKGEYAHTLKLAKMLINDRHDLMQKAVGWMLREVGKRCSMPTLEDFLEEHAATMPRTALRYSLEHMTPEKKHYFMHAKFRI
ncbi:MAG: DNA alkylation repair protein [Candidatus Babeliales bacterium]|jgi:3-methyladenine DNA glycosylase AlkD